MFWLVLTSHNERKNSSSHFGWFLSRWSTCVNFFFAKFWQFSAHSEAAILSSRWNFCWNTTPWKYFPLISPCHHPSSFWMKKLLIPSVPFRLLLSSPPTCEVRPPLACSSTVSLCDRRQRLCGNFILLGTKTMGVSCLEHDWRRILTIQELLFLDTSKSVCLFLFGKFLIEVVCGDRTGWQPHHFFCTLTGRMIHIIGRHTENIFFKYLPAVCLVTLIFIIQASDTIKCLNNAAVMLNWLFKLKAFGLCVLCVLFVSHKKRPVFYDE